MLGTPALTSAGGGPAIMECGGGPAIMVYTLTLGTELHAIMVYTLTVGTELLDPRPARRGRMVPT